MKIMTFATQSTHGYSEISTASTASTASPPSATVIGEDVLYHPMLGIEG